MKNEQENGLYQQPPAVPTVHLRAAPLPIIGLLAVHLHFVVSSGKEPWQRWEVWQSKNALREPKNTIKKAYGHLYVNLIDPLGGVGGGPTFLVQSWSGEPAEKIIAALNANAGNYISGNRYLLWPGPNCNTYAARILDYAGVPASLPGTAIGKDWDGIFNFKFSHSPFRLIFHTPLIGVNISLTEDLELNIFGGTIIGMNFRFQEFKYPLGRGVIKL